MATQVLQPRADFSICRQCGDPIVRTRDPWNNQWRRQGDIKRCKTMIGCIPVKL